MIDSNAFARAADIAGSINQALVLSNSDPVIAEYVAYAKFMGTSFEGGLDDFCPTLATGERVISPSSEYVEVFFAAALAYPFAIELNADALRSTSLDFVELFAGKTLVVIDSSFAVFSEFF